MKRDQYLLSIIVPVYNVRDDVVHLMNELKTLDESLVEVIIIDDGSTDNSGQIALKTVGGGHVNFKFITQENQGLSVARNRGLKKSHGEYIWFVDSDDLIETVRFPEICNILRSKSPDVFQFSYQMFKSENELVTPDGSSIAYVETTGKCLFEQLAENKLQNYAWQHIVRENVYRNFQIEFPAELQFEDMATTYKIFMHSDKAILSTTQLYYYRNRNNSIVNSVSEKSMTDLLKIAELIGNDRVNMPDRLHADLLYEMALLIALGRTTEGKKSHVSEQIQKNVIARYLEEKFRIRGIKQVKTWIRKFLMVTRLYMPLSSLKMRLHQF